MNTKYKCYSLTHYFLMPPPSYWHLCPEKTWFTLLPFNFLKCRLIVQGGFAMELQVCIYHALIKLTPITHSFSITMLPYYSIAYSTINCIIIQYNEKQ
jgi:hypothetical protein